MSKNFFSLYKYHPIKNFKDESLALRACNKYVQKLKTIIISSLNKKSEKIKSKKFYNLLLDPWLNLYVSSIYLKYILIKNIKVLKFENSNIYKSQILTFEMFGKAIQRDEAFNIQIVRDISQILKKKIIFKKNSYQKSESSFFENIFFKIKNLIKYLVSNSIFFLSNIFYKKKVYLDINLNFSEVVKLILLSKFKFTLPKITLINNKKDVFLFKKKTNDEFLNILILLFNKYTPKKYLNILNHLPKLNEEKKNLEKKNILITSFLSSGDEDRIIFRSTYNQNLRIFSVQHGGGYGQIKNFYLENYEKKNSEQFLTWGWKEKRKNTTPLAFRKNYQKKNDENHNKVLFVGPNFCPFEFRIGTVPLGSRVFTNSGYSKNEGRILNALKKYCKVTYKPHPDSYISQNIQKNKLIKINKTEKLIELAKKTDLIILSHISTAFMEILSLNIPTLIYLERNLYEFNKSFNKYLKLLRKYKIIHYDVNSLLSFLDKEHDQFKFWHKPKVQILINELLNNYYLKDKIYLKKIRSFLNSELVKK